MHAGCWWSSRRIGRIRRVMHAGVLVVLALAVSSARVGRRCSAHLLSRTRLKAALGG